MKPESLLLLFSRGIDKVNSGWFLYCGENGHISFLQESYTEDGQIVYPLILTLMSMKDLFFKNNV